MDAKVTDYDALRGEYSRIAAEHVSDSRQRVGEAKMQRLFGNAQIPPRFQSRNFANFQDTTLAQQCVKAVCEGYAQRFDHTAKEGSCLVFCGKPGTGKTHLATAIANHLLAQGRSAVFRTVLQAVRTVKETYSRRSEISETEALSRMLAPELLILDEVGVQFGSDTERLILFEIINGRYEQVKPTLLISNLTEAELGTYLGERILDRMYEGGGAVLAFDWESHRRKAK